MTACVSLFGDQPEVMMERLRILATRRRVVELRIDRMRNADWSALAEASGSLQVVLAAVPEDQGGEFSGDPTEWAQALQEPVAAFGDRAIVDLPPFIERVPAFLTGANRLWSWHETRGVTDTDLNAVLERLKVKGGPEDRYKIVAWADRHEHSMRAVRLLQEKGGSSLIAFAQGPGGRASRVWAPALGSPWTYASWAGETTAPGQWAEDELPADADWPELECFGVFGDPIEHSKSPELWGAAFRWLNLQNGSRSDAGPARERQYLRLQHASLADFRAQYASDRFQAFSVTAPLKREALLAAESADSIATQVGVANLLYRDRAGAWRAGCTDGEGALRPLREAGLQRQSPLLILGAGGAARAVVAAALREQRRVTVAARRLSQAEELIADMARSARGEGLDAETDLSLRAVDLAADKLIELARGESDQLGVIQATPLGSEHSPGNPLQTQRLAAGDVVLDMVYSPWETALLQQARRQGATPVQGHLMLLAQMQRQFELVFNETPPRAPLQLCLESALGKDQLPIFLCGPRASGKSTLGAWLAHVLDWDFVDADALLEERHARALSHWVKEDLRGFREAESTLLTELFEERRTVVALGGGVVETEEARERLHAHPRVLGLRLSAAEQLARRQAVDHRPALTELGLAEEIQLLHERRMPLYEKACAGRWVNVGGKKAESFHCLLDRLKLLV